MDGVRCWVMPGRENFLRCVSAVFPRCVSAMFARRGETVRETGVFRRCRRPKLISLGECSIERHF